MAKNLVTTQEAAMQLGLSPATLRKWISCRKINFVRIGRAVRFRQEDLEQMVKEGFRPKVEA